MEEEVEEPNILDVAKDLMKVWPFSLLFPEDAPDTRDRNRKKKPDEGPPIEIPKPIRGHNINQGIDQGLGQLHFVLKYDVNAQKLKIILIEAKNIVGKDPRGTSDPYAVITFDPRFRDEGLYKTEVKLKTLNPIFNHVFVFLNFTDDDLERYKIHLTLYDYDKYLDHEALGEVYYDLIKLRLKDQSKINSVNMDPVENVSTHEKNSVLDWVDRTDTRYDIDELPGKSIAITEDDERVVERSASMIFNSNLIFNDEMEENEEDVENEEDDDDETQEDKSQQDPNNLDIAKDAVKFNVIRRIEIKKNLQALPNSRSAFGEILISLDYMIRSRLLIVNVIKARNMIDPGKRSLIPYCTIRHIFIGSNREITRSTHQTSYRFYSENPVWNEEFGLKVSPDKLKQTAVEIQVFHSTKESNPSDEVLGLIRLGLKTYPTQRAHYVEFLSNIGKPIAQWHLIRT